MDAMNAVSKALDTDTDAEPEQPTLRELAVSLCRSSHCHYFDGFGCTRSDVVTDGERLVLVILIFGERRMNNQEKKNISSDTNGHRSR